MKNFSPEPTDHPLGHFLWKLWPFVRPYKVKAYLGLFTNATARGFDLLPLVIIGQADFNPQELTIKRFDQVSWKNESGSSCTLVINDKEILPISHGENFTQAFDITGEYNFYCTTAPEATGTIIVL